MRNSIDWILFDEKFRRSFFSSVELKIDHDGKFLFETKFPDFRRTFSRENFLLKLQSNCLTYLNDVRTKDFHIDPNSNWKNKKKRKKFRFKFISKIYVVKICSSVDFVESICWRNVFLKLIHRSFFFNSLICFIDVVVGWEYRVWRLEIGAKFIEPLWTRISNSNWKSFFIDRWKICNDEENFSSIDVFLDIGMNSSFARSFATTRSIKSSIKHWISFLNIFSNSQWIFSSSSLENKTKRRFQSDWSIELTNVRSNFHYRKMSLMFWEFLLIIELSWREKTNTWVSFVDHRRSNEKKTFQQGEKTFSCVDLFNNSIDRSIERWMTTVLNQFNDQETHSSFSSYKSISNRYWLKTNSTSVPFDQSAFLFFSLLSRLSSRLSSHLSSHQSIESLRKEQKRYSLENDERTRRILWRIY